ATGGLALLSTPITRVLFERGRFGPEDTAATAIALIWYAVGLVGFAGARIVAQAFYAVARPGVAVRLGALAIAANLVAAMVLMGPMGHGGLALASSIGSYVNLFGLLWVARRDFGLLGGRALVISAARTLAASAPLALWCVLLRFVAPAGRGAPGAAGRGRRGDLPRGQHAPRLSGARHAARDVAVPSPRLI